MSDRAHFQKNYLMRYAILAGVCSLLGLWFAYDGFIGYPKKIPAAEAYDELRELESEERIEQWQAIAAERGWSDEIPEKAAKEIRDDIKGQYFWTILNICVALPALILLLRARGSWVEPTEDGLTTSWGQSLRFSDVTSLNKKRWSDKGLAKATYTDGGKSKVFVFDDFKFEREPIKSMLMQLEQVLSRDQIVGGPTEAEAAAQKAAEEAAEEAEYDEDSDDEDYTSGAADSESDIHDSERSNN